MKHKLIGGLLLLIIIACAIWIPMQWSLFEGDDGWQVSTPAAEGMDEGIIDDMLSQMGDDDDKNIDSLIVVRNQKIVVEYYANGYSKNRKHTIQSAEKSIIALLIGIAIDKGIISSVDNKMIDFYQEQNIENNDERKQSITLRDLLSMRGGFDWDEFSPYYTGEQSPIKDMNRTRNHVKYALNAPMGNAPGSKFAYNTGGCVILLDIISKAADMPSDRFADEYLFSPLGIRSYTWIKDKLFFGTPRDLYLRPRDMAKIGQLVLLNGEWNGQRVISEEWLQEMLAPHTAYIHDGVVAAKYGYLWWLYPDGKTAAKIYTCLGKGGQMIYVVPDYNMVVVSTGKKPGDDVYDDIASRTRPANLLYDYILPSVIDEEQYRAGRTR